MDKDALQITKLHNKQPNGQCGGEWGSCGVLASAAVLSWEHSSSGILRNLVWVHVCMHFTERATSGIVL
jgi:hypothetical protein